MTSMDMLTVDAIAYIIEQQEKKQMSDEKEGASQHPPMTEHPFDQVAEQKRVQHDVDGGLYPPFLPAEEYERILQESTESALNEGIGVIEVVSVGAGHEHPSAEVIPPPMVVGDLTSDERGTGARANGDKPKLELLPITVMAEALTPQNSHQRYVRNALLALGKFQSGYDGALDDVLVSTALAAGMSLIDLMVEAAGVLDYGRTKYAEFNWAKGMPWSVCIACAERHLLLHMWGDPLSVDGESKRLHAGHVACNVLFLKQYLRNYNDGDDRPPQLAE